MNILIIIPYGGVGGMERLALNFYTYYKSKGFKVKALKIIKLETDIIHFGNDELFLKSYDFNTMSRIERLFFYIKTPFLIRNIIQKHKITHSISFGDMANLFSSLTFTQEFKIASIHALKSVEFQNKTPFNRLFQMSYRTSYRNFYKVVCISKSIKEDLINQCHYVFNNLEVIYNPHDIDSIVKLGKEEIQKKKELEIFLKKTITFLGRLSIQKAPWHLLKSFSLVLKRLPETNLVIIGDGDEKVAKHIQVLIAELNLNNNVFLLGRKSNPYMYLSKSTVLVLSSHYEGTPNVIVEAIAVGTPVVSSLCTNGVMELMSLSDFESTNNNIIVEAGIITPNLFNGELGIPNSNEFIKEEYDLADGLCHVLTDNNFKNNLTKNKEQLLAKFNLIKVADMYLKNNNIKM